MRRAAAARGAARGAAAVLLAAALLGACSDDDDTPDETGTTPTTETTAPSTDTTGGDETTTTPTTEPEPEADPLEAAQAFMDTVFPGSTATLGEFQEGDSRSGEVPVFRPSEGGGPANLASTLLLRLDETDTWQVIGAASEFVTIESPTNATAVPATVPLTVSGAGRGFEATLIVRAFAVGGGQVGETAVTTGGALETPEPYEATVDLSSATPGTDVFIVVNGGTGLEGDTGEFGAVRITVS